MSGMDQMRIADLRVGGPGRVREKDSLVKLTYRLGWFFLVAALVFRALLRTSEGYEIAVLTGVAPRNLLQMSSILFLICVATDAYERARTK